MRRKDRDPSFVAFDPGLTTGACFMDNGNIILTKTYDFEGMFSVCAMERPFYIGIEAIVCESFRLYGHKAQTMTGSSFPSCEVIGALKTLALRMGIPIVFQSASNAKGKWTDDRLDAELERRGYKLQRKFTHERDAVRHALFYLKQRMKKDDGSKE